MDIINAENHGTPGTSENVVAQPARSAAALALPLELPLREARDALMAQFERAYVAARLQQQNGNVSATARAMGVSRRYLHRLIARYEIRRSELQLAVAR